MWHSREIWNFIPPFMLIAIQPIVTNMFFGEPLDYGNPLHYEDMGSKISLFQLHVQRYEGCKVEVLKLGQRVIFSSS